MSVGAPKRHERVLVVDDEEQIRRALRSVLQVRGYDVDLADSAEEALEMTADAHARPHHPRPHAARA